MTYIQRIKKLEFTNRIKKYSNLTCNGLSLMIATLMIIACSNDPEYTASTTIDKTKQESENLEQVESDEKKTQVSDLEDISERSYSDEELQTLNAPYEDKEDLEVIDLSKKPDLETIIISEEQAQLESLDLYERDTVDYLESIEISYSEVGIDEGGGHFDVDSFNLLSGEKEHEHEYDKKFSTNGFIFLGRPNPGSGSDSYDKKGKKKKRDKDKCQIILNQDRKFRIKIINEQYSKDGVILINNEPYNWSKSPDPTQIYSLSGIDNTIRLDELSVVFPLDKLRADGIRKTSPSPVKGNEIGPNNSRRHGALTVQIYHAYQEKLLWEGSIYWHKK